LSGLGNHEKEKSYNKAFSDWQANGYADFNTISKLFQKSGEMQFCDASEVRSRLICNPESRQTQGLKSGVMGIRCELYKAIIGWFTHNLMKVIKLCLAYSNDDRDNKMHFIQALTGDQIKNLLDRTIDRYEDNHIVSTDASKCDATRNEFLRKLDIASFRCLVNPI